MEDNEQYDIEEALEALATKASEDAAEYRIPAADLLKVWEIGLTIYLAEKEIR